MMQLPWSLPGGQQVQFTPYQIAGRNGGDATVIGSGALSSENYVAGSSGWRIDGLGNVEFESGEFRGDISGASGSFSSTIDVGGDDASSFHVDIDGGIWSGASIANKATAPFRVSNDGSLVATDAIISGAITAATVDIGSGATSFHVNTDGNVWAGATTYATTVPFRILNTGDLHVGGDDSSSFHIDATGAVWIGSSIANRATAPITISNTGRFVANDAASGAQVIIDGITEGAYIGFDSGDALQIAEAYIWNYEAGSTIWMAMTGGDTTDVATIPSIALGSDTVLNIAKVQIDADRLDFIGSQVSVSGNGSVTAPAISIGDPNNGIYASNDDTIDIAANGVRIAAFYDDGEVNYRYGTMYSGISGTHFMSFYYDGTNIRGVAKNAGGATVVDLVLG